jgi:hypothetical protein
MMNRKVAAILALLMVMAIPQQPFAVAFRPSAYQTGPVFHTSTNHVINIQYDDTVLAQDIQTGNNILKMYLPKLLDIFWTPTYDLTVTVFKSSCPGLEVSCASEFNVWMSNDKWSFDSDSLWAWVHEFTHVLQHSGPAGAFVRDTNPELLYTEPTASAAATILVPYATSWWTDWSFLLPQYGVSDAIYSYALQKFKEDRHAPFLPAWTSLYDADPSVFRTLNAKLNDLSAKGLRIVNVPSLRALIGESVRYETLDNLPIRQWLAVEGLLGEDELGDSAIVFVDGYYTEELDAAALSIEISANSNLNHVTLDPAKTFATIYDAISRKTIAVLMATGIGPSDPLSDYFSLKLSTDLPPLPAIRVDLHVVALGVNLTENLSILMPYHSSPKVFGLGDVQDVILFPSSDGWLQSINGTENVAGSAAAISNGILRLGVKEPANLSLPTAEGAITNFVPSSKVTVLGLNHTAVGLMHDSPKIFLSQGQVYSLGTKSNVESIQSLVTTIVEIWVTVAVLALSTLFVFRRMRGRRNSNSHVQSLERG